MGHRLPEDLLLELRTYLEHFDQTAHFGEGETVAEIKLRLKERIREVEAQIRISSSRKAPASMRSGADSLVSQIAC